jgi:exopolyphosphatase/guanosine-5'-triphosphate,3'-diphosphate pyrophosphatase
MTVVPRWEWRAFGEDLGIAEGRIAALTPERVEVSDEVYLLSLRSDASVKVRTGRVDAKRLLRVDGEGLEQWVPVLKAAFPLSGADVASVLALLGVDGASASGGAAGVEALVSIVDADPDLLAVDVHKQREHYTLGGCMAERSELRTDAGAIRTIAVESPDPARVSAVVRELRLSSLPVTCVARGLKALIGFRGRRWAVIDVGTNSVKFHAGEQDQSGRWRTVVDRAAVTRLGERQQPDGRLDAVAIGRTVEAIAAMAAQARRLGATQIAAVGTAGLRRAPNAVELIDAVRARCGVEVEVLPAEDEARLAYLAATHGLDLAGGSLAVFDTGGGSSQFTFAHDGQVDERFSVGVGAVPLTERYRLDGETSQGTLEAALRAIEDDLARLGGRDAPDAVVGMGGAVTNLAAVQQGLATYDRDAVHGSVLARDEIERQLSLYRTRSAEQRRAIVGLQPNRAEVILAGACIVRSVLTMLGAEALTVSDRGLRHGLLVERFGRATAAA